MMQPTSRWEPWELALLNSNLPISLLTEKLGRTRSAIKDRRYRLRHPERVKQKRRRMEVQREKKLYGKKAKYRGWTYLDDAELLGLPWSQKAHLAYASKHKRTYAGVKSRRAKLSVSGVKTVTNLKGIRFITAEGDKISLDKYIQDTQVVEEIQELYQQEISERHRSRGRVTVKGHMPKKEGVSKRVRRLTQQEIRKEYGMRDSPHKRDEGGLRADVLWLIRHKSPITAASAAEILEKNSSSISAIFSNLWKFLGNTYIERSPTSPFEYRPLQHYDVQVAYKIVLEAERKATQERRAEPEPPPEPPAEPESPAEPEKPQPLFTRVKALEEVTMDSLKELARMIEMNSERIITLAQTQQEWLEAGIGKGGGTQTLRVEFIFGWKK